MSLKQIKIAAHANESNIEISYFIRPDVDASQINVRMRLCDVTDLPTSRE